jgi:phosphate transport system substrate-binding protein
LPLPKQAYATAMKHYNEGRVGSVFGGTAKIGITIDQLLAMEAKL